ncbi:hypothetical protein NE865_13529 [Phthorimaea operculella]|nr:hypothetical protein NE865_13529 [Phthorimaea operculella]
MYQPTESICMEEPKFFFIIRPMSFGKSGSVSWAGSSHKIFAVDFLHSVAVECCGCKGKICDANGRIMSVNPNFPGSTHDAAIWRQSNIHQQERQYVSGIGQQWLLGKSITRQKY